MKIALTLAVALSTLGCLGAPVPTLSPAVRSGTSMADAIIVQADSETSGVRQEYAYIATLKCADGTGVYRMTQQALLNKDGHAYDLLSVKCSIGDEKRDIYFDITSFFGKY